MYYNLYTNVGTKPSLFDPKFYNLSEMLIFFFIKIDTMDNIFIACYFKM